jgi:hypothetical protein
LLKKPPIRSDSAGGKIKTLILALGSDLYRNFIKKSRSFARLPDSRNRRWECRKLVASGKGFGALSDAIQKPFSVVNMPVPLLAEFDAGILLENVGKVWRAGAYIIVMMRFRTEESNKIVLASLQYCLTRLIRSAK